MYSLVGGPLPIRTRGSRGHFTALAGGRRRWSMYWALAGTPAVRLGYWSARLLRHGRSSRHAHIYIYTCHPDGGADLCWRADGRVGAWHETVLKTVLKHGYATRVLTA